jgi:hypothetical protein
MGTRALILKNNKKWVYTHYNAFPSKLGKTLKKIKGKTNAQQKHMLHHKHLIDYDFEKHAWINTDSKKSFKKLTYKKGTHNDFFDYIYNIIKGKIYYSIAGNWTNDKLLLSSYKWKEL